MQPLTKKGECECCPKTDVEITKIFTMWMCNECKEKELALQAESNKPENIQKRVDAARDIVIKSREIDSNIQVKTDLFNAATVASVELRAAINNNPEIADDQKEYAYTNECYERFMKLKQVIFEERQELLRKENEMRMWQLQTQQSAAKLRAELREKFKGLDINYQPATPKSPKPAAPKTPKKSFNRKELYAALAKFGLNGTHAAMVQTMVTAKNLKVEDAAKQLATNIGLYKE